MRPERLHNILKARANRAVYAESVTTLRSATAAKLSSFFRDESERESQAEQLRSHLPNKYTEKKFLILSDNIVKLSSHSPYTSMALSGTDLHF